jgi:hypothetical protein
MAHLAARPRRALAVEVNGGAGHRQPLLVVEDIVADQVGHGDLAVTNRLAERPAGNRPDVLLELRDRGAVQRPVPGIMHPRRNLVDQHVRSAVSGNDEQFDREHADIVQGVGDLLGDGARVGGQRIRYRGRHAREFQDVIAVFVFGDVVAFDLAVRRARGDHGDLALEGNEGFEDRGFGAEVFPDLRGIVASRMIAWPLPS